MAKRQNFIVGSTNPNTNTWTSSQLNNGWNKYQVLKSGDLDGVFKAVSDYSNDSSQEIWNAIRILKGSNPTGTSTSELGNIISTVLGTKATKATDFITPLTSDNKGATQTDLNTLREEIETSSLTFKGYVATSAPSASTYGLVEGNIWINASEMPTTFPVAIAGIWNGTSWATTTDTYTVQDFDFFRNINDGEGYYWFGGQWVVMSTDMSTTYFTLNQTSGKWEIKPSVNLPGSPTTTTPTSSSPDNQIATKKYVDEAIAPLPTTTYFPDLFDMKWADYICNDVQWLRADTFSWQSGAVYQVAYAHLVDDYNEVPDSSWAPATQDANLGDKAWNGLAWDGTKFVALGFYGYVSSSTDGINWTVATQNTNLGENAWSSLSWNGTKFVALGQTGHVSSSTDGINWTVATQNTNLGNNTWSGLAWNGTKFVALGRYGHVSTSTDGTNWTAATQDVNLGNNNWRGLAWDGTKFVALSFDGYVSSSTDGTTWTTATQDDNLRNRSWIGLAWGDNKFVALSTFAYVSTSKDSTNWTTATQDANLGTNMWSVLAWGDTKFVALGGSSHTSYKLATYQTETIAGITIEYYLAEDGHKLVLPDQESNVMAIYNATGVAWYYIIDTTNQRFKLPRSKHNKYADFLSVVGNGMTLGLTDGTINAGLGNSGNGVYFPSTLGYGENVGTAAGGTGQAAGRNIGVTTDPEKSGVIAQQEQDTDQYKYLYFYVGQFTQTALENTAGVTTEVLNDKVDKGHQVVEFQAPTAANNYTWYRKYADGWVEQGGKNSGTGLQTTSLPITMADANYTTLITTIYGSAGADISQRYVQSQTTSSFQSNSVSSGDFYWQVSGMATN